MTTLPIADAQARLAEIIATLIPGQEVTLTDNGQPLAKLVRTKRTSWPCKAGSYKKEGFWMAPDFDAPLDDFKEYME